MARLIVIGNADREDNWGASPMQSVYFVQMMPRTGDSTGDEASDLLLENSVHVGYRYWDDFCNAAGLSEGPYSARADGCYPLSESDYRQICEAVTRLSGWRLNIALWLKHWVRWALDNCDRPAIQV